MADRGPNSVLLGNALIFWRLELRQSFKDFVTKEVYKRKKMWTESEWREEKLNVHFSKSVSRQPSRNGGLIVSGRFDGTSSAVVAIEKHITVAEWLSLLQTCGLHSRYIVASSQLPREAKTSFDVS